jgi:steroid delta-isomerase-like uncharacterized protein
VVDPMSEENKALAHRAWEVVFNQRNLDALYEFYAPNAVWHQPDQDLQGLEEVKQWLARPFEAFPDLNVSVEDVIAEGDKVVIRYTSRGTHQGETGGLGPPTGRQIELEGIAILRFEGDKIVEFWDRFDNLSLLQQLGLAPEQ